MAMKTAPKRKLVSMDAPSREAVRKGNDNDAAGKTGLLENGVDSKIMDICIDDIRLNPDNAIFVENDMKRILTTWPMILKRMACCTISWSLK